MKKRSNSKFRTVISLILSFLLSLMLLAADVLLIANNTVMSGEYMLKHLKKTNYYNNLAEDINEIYVSYGMASGVSEDFFHEAVDNIDIYSDVSEYVIEAYSGNKYQPNLNKHKSILKEKLIVYAQTNGITIEESSQKSIDDFIDLCISHYIEQVKIPFITNLGEYANQYRTALLIINVILIVLAAGLMIILIFMHKWKHRAIRFISYALLASGLMISVVPATILVSGIVPRIAITSKPLYLFAVSYISGVSWVLLISGLVLFIFGIVSATLIYKTVKREG